uniref:Uncharacterized protein n=1 Tax=Panstrongylus lignarius TaxID=156445 RepID=A0A224Y1I6_9HEMI
MRPVISSATCFPSALASNFFNLLAKNSHFLATMNCFVRASSILSLINVSLFTATRVSSTHMFITSTSNNSFSNSNIVSPPVCTLFSILEIASKISSTF